MRVISGNARGRKLLVPEGLKTRPTTDRIKETLFNIMAFDIPNCYFLDLFSGSGAIGIEALSRGAKEVTFVDSDMKAYNCIIENLKNVKLEQKSKVYNCEIEKFMLSFSSEYKYDIIFMDPPYYENYVTNTLNQIKKYDILNENGYVVIEKATELVDIQVEGFIKLKEKKFKTTTMIFMSRQEN